MKTKKMKPSADLKLRVYSIVSDAVDSAISAGFYRAHKHVDTPSAAEVHEAVLAAVMSELCDIIDFGD